MTIDAAGVEHRPVTDVSCVCGRSFASANGLRSHVVRPAGPIRHGTAHAYKVGRCRCDVCRAARRDAERQTMANRHVDATLLERDERIWNSRVSSEYGCTVTFENEAGETLTLSRRGAPDGVFRDLCAVALAADPTFLVVAVSSPQTILSDLNGIRAKVGTRGEKTMPETAVAARCGLLPLVHPRLRGGQVDRAARREQRRYRGWRDQLGNGNGAAP